MTASERRRGFTVMVIVAALATACGTSERSTEETGAAKATVSAQKETYPAPRWPSYFKVPRSVDELMPAARALVRNQSGFQGKGMGILQPGEAVMIVAADTADPMVLTAIRRALEERKITPHIKFTYELLGRTREQVERERQQARQGRNIEMAGIYQASQWITGQFADPEVPKRWLRERRPDVYRELFPEEFLPGAAGGASSPRRRAGGEGGGEEETGEGRRLNQREREQLGAAIKAYLKAHPEIRGVFWGGGGTTGLRRALYPMQDKYLGTFITDNVYNLQSQMSAYPGDVWQLAEEHTLEPLAYVDRLEVTDPEGTNLWSTFTEEMTERWVQGSYQRGHLYMFPNQATGRFGYSFVNYPAFQQKWLPREPLATIDGVLAGTQGHGGFFPRWEVYFKNGFIVDVKGGGAHGEALKEFLNYPGIRETVYPYHKTPGYWYLYEIAFGTHPKAFRHPLPLLETGNTSPERARSGVIHWGLGSRMWHDPDAPMESKVWAEFTEKHNLPRDHGFHTHTYFTTYRLRLRKTDKWVSLLDKGRMTSLDHPEVRALASRYGDPDYLLAEDWTPEVPGINAPGDYLKDYAPNPGRYALRLLDRALKGLYEHYFPPPGTRLPTLTPATTEAAAGRRTNEP